MQSKQVNAQLKDTYYIIEEDKTVNSKANDNMQGITLS